MRSYLNLADHHYLFQLVQMGYNETICRKNNDFSQLLENEHFVKIYGLYKDFVKSRNGKTPYLDMATDYVAEKLGLKLSNEEKNNLKSNCYYASSYLDEEKWQEYRAKMENDGWKLLTEQAIKDAYEAKKKMEISAKMENDWMSSKVAETYKPFVNHDGNCYLMPKRSRSRGFSISRFTDAFYKLV